MNQSFFVTTLMNQMNMIKMIELTDDCLFIVAIYLDEIDKLMLHLTCTRFNQLIMPKLPTSTKYWKRWITILEKHRELLQSGESWIQLRNEKRCIGCREPDSPKFFGCELIYLCSYGEWMDERCPKLPTSLINVINFIKVKRLCKTRYKCLRDDGLAEFYPRRTNNPYYTDFWLEEIKVWKPSINFDQLINHRYY